MWGRELQTLIERASRMEGALQHTQEEKDRLLGEISDLREQNLTLTRQMVDMKREGFEPLVPVSLPPVEEEAALPEQVERAIRIITDPGTDLYAELVKDAWRMLEGEGLEPEKVATLTLRGGAYRNVEAYE